MTELENKFLDEFKSVEIFLNDAYKTQHGVTTYIDKMRDLQIGWDTIPGWKNEFYSLKRVRHIRNFLTHERGISECEEEDLYYLEDFYERLLNQEDPIAQLYIKQSKKNNHYNSLNTENNRSEVNGMTYVLLILIVVALVVVMYIAAV